MARIYRTPWGEIRPSVDVVPVLIVLISYGLIYFLPGHFFARIFHGDDGPVEWLQVLALVVAALASTIAAWRGRRHARPVQVCGWLLLALACLLLAGEEISWGQRLLSGVSNPALQGLNVQGETNLHNIKGVNSLMHVSYIVFGLGLGFAGWRFLPRLACLPPRELSLYFLPLALFAAYLDVSWLTNLERIRNDQELFEFLAYLGLAVNGCRGAFPAWWAAHQGSGG